jgi:hypothetical protein
MKSHYRHLNAEERGVIFAEHQRGSSLRGIGLLLARHHGTIGHELKRGVVPAGYDPQVARRALLSDNHLGRWGWTEDGLARLEGSPTGLIDFGNRCWSLRVGKLGSSAVKRRIRIGL